MVLAPTGSQYISLSLRVCHRPLGFPATKYCFKHIIVGHRRLASAFVHTSMLLDGLNVLSCGLECDCRDRNQVTRHCLGAWSGSLCSRALNKTHSYPSLFEVSDSPRVQVVEVTLDTPIPPTPASDSCPHTFQRTFLPAGSQGLSPPTFPHFDFTMSVIGQPCHFPFFPFVISLGFGQTPCEQVPL